MSDYNVKPIALDFKVSRLLISVLSIAGVGACVIIVCMPINAVLKLLLCSLVLLATGYHLADKGLLRLPWSCTGLRLNTKGELTASTRAGTEYAVDVLSNTFVASYLTVLNYRVGGKRGQRSILLLPDNTDADAFRRLRVWLRWARQPSLATET